MFAERIRCPIRRGPAPRLEGWTVPPPPAGTGVCEICHGPAGHAFRRCWSCEVVRRRLALASVPPIVPISLFVPGEPLHAALVGYKSDPDASRRSAWSAALAELVGWFLAVHGRCLGRLAGGGWDVLEVVPSTRRSEPGHPLTCALRQLPVLGRRTGLLLERGSGAVAHLEPSPAAFAVRAAAAGARVLLLDDVFTSGSHALSAAAALEAGGARVVAIVPVGRIVHADGGAAAADWWAAHSPAADRSPRRCAARRCCCDPLPLPRRASERPPSLREAAACRASSWRR